MSTPEKLALFYEDKGYFLTSNTMSGFQISTQKSWRETGKEAGREEGGKEGQRGTEGERGGGGTEGGRERDCA